jgi:fructokinase
VNLAPHLAIAITASNKEIMTPHRPCIVGFGELVWDVLPHATLPGGAPANFAWQAQQFGARGVVISAVGDDPAGRELMAWLRKMGLDADSIQITMQNTGRVDIQVSAEGEPGYRIQDDSAWDSIRWTDALADIARRADCVCFGSLAQRSPISRESLYHFLRATTPQCLRIFDINLRQPAPEVGIIKGALRFTDVLKLNEEEWSFIAAKLFLPSDWSIGCRELLRGSNICLVALTRGAQGSVLITDEEILELPAEPVDINDTIGAGDAFSATLAIGILRGIPLGEIQKVAAKTAAFVCTQAGATPRLPEHLKALMNAPVRSIQLSILSRLRSASTFVLPKDVKAAFDSEPAESH